MAPCVKVSRNKQTKRSFFVLINNRSIMFFTFEFLCLSFFVSFVFCFYSSDCFFWGGEGGISLKSGSFVSFILLHCCRSN